MKQIIRTVLLMHFTYATAFCQENFIPTKPDHVSESDFRAGEHILKNSYQQLAEDGFNVVASDYWNFATAYYKMGQPKEMIYDFLYKARYTDKKSFCEIVNYYHENKHGIDSAGFFKLLGEEYRELVADCSKIESEEIFDIDDYIQKNKYDKALIYKLQEILQEDQKWRKVGDENMGKQTEADGSNILSAEEIINKYGYPGTKMVGPKFDFVIWIVIQHADLSFQEKYLPLIAKANCSNQYDT